MATNLLSAIAAPTSTDLADWFELAAFVAERRRLSPGSARDLLEVFGGGADETDIALAFGELNTRAGRQLENYPFRFSRLGIELTDVDVSPYLVLLLTAASSSGYLELADGTRASVALELLVTDALFGLMGPRSITIRFGVPTEPERPPNFGEAVEWLGVKMGARRLPLLGADHRRADGGIDVIGWIGHNDNFGPGPVVAAQVTYERDLRGKSLEIASGDFHRWYRLPQPVPVLASPVDGAADPDLMIELTGRVLVLDRWRLLRGLVLSQRLLADASREWATGVVAELEI